MGKENYENLKAVLELFRHDLLCELVSQVGKEGRISCNHSNVARVALSHH